MATVRFLSFDKPGLTSAYMAALALLTLGGSLFIGCGGRNDSGSAPSEIPDLVLWLDAQAIEDLRDGDLLGTWHDSSEHGNDATQELGTKRPKYAANAHHDQPAVRFDGQNDVLVIPDSNSLDMGTGDMSIVVVYSRSDSPTDNLRLLAKGASTNLRQGYAIMGNNDKVLLIVSNGSADRTTVNASDQVIDRATLTTLVVDRGVQMRAYRDGALKGTTSLRSFGIETWDNRDDLNIGALNPTPNIPWKGDIMELLIYKRHLSDLERRALESYLAEKWRIDLQEGGSDLHVRNVPNAF